MPFHRRVRNTHRATQVLARRTQRLSSETLRRVETNPKYLITTPVHGLRPRPPLAHLAAATCDVGIALADRASPSLLRIGQPEIDRQLGTFRKSRAARNFAMAIERASVARAVLLSCPSPNRFYPTVNQASAETLGPRVGASSSRFTDCVLTMHGSLADGWAHSTVNPDRRNRPAAEGLRFEQTCR